MLLAELSVVGARVCCRGAGSFAREAAAQEQGLNLVGARKFSFPKRPGSGFTPWSQMAHRLAGMRPRPSLRRGL